MTPENSSENHAPGFNYTYSFRGYRDSVGRIKERREIIETKEFKVNNFMYFYNDRGYLTKIVKFDDSYTGGYRTEFSATYDKNGNRKSIYSPYHRLEGGAGHTYDDQDRLRVFGPYRYEYNAAGALISKRDTNFTYLDPADDLITEYRYDQGNNLLQVNLPNGNEIRYTVDALNVLVGILIGFFAELKLYRFFAFSRDLMWNWRGIWDF